MDFIAEVLEVGPLVLVDSAPSVTISMWDVAAWCRGAFSEVSNREELI